MQMSKSMSSSVVPVVPRGPPGQDVPYLNTESLSVKSHTINSMGAPQTVNCQAINALSATVCHSLTSYRPHLHIIGHTRGGKVHFLIILRIMRFELFPNANA